MNYSNTILLVEKNNLVSEACDDLCVNKGQLHIWKTKFSRHLNDLPIYWNILSEDEKLRAKTYKFLKDRNNYVIARGILRSILAKYIINSKPCGLKFNYSIMGKPYLVCSSNFNRLKFNLSHSGDAIVYAVSQDNEVGIDVEIMNRNFYLEEIIDYFFSAQEKAHFIKLTSKYERYNFFYNTWVAKEAIIKAFGTGFFHNITNITIQKNKDSLINAYNFVKKKKYHWTIKHFFSYNGYYSAYATECTIDKINFFVF